MAIQETKEREPRPAKGQVGPVTSGGTVEGQPKGKPFPEDEPLVRELHPGEAADVARRIGLGYDKEVEPGEQRDN